MICVISSTCAFSCRDMSKRLLWKNWFWEEKGKLMMLKKESLYCYIDSKDEALCVKTQMLTMAPFVTGLPKFCYRLIKMQSFFPFKFLCAMGPVWNPLQDPSRSLPPSLGALVTWLIDVRTCPQAGWRTDVSLLLTHQYPLHVHCRLFEEIFYFDAIETRDKVIIFSLF